MTHPQNMVKPKVLGLNDKLILATALLLTACGKPIPPDKLSYVGEWQSPTMSLLINEDGYVSYRRVRGNTTTTIEAPIQNYIGHDFEVGIGSFSTTFVVSSLPHQENGQWKMTVDGVELIKTQ